MSIWEKAATDVMLISFIKMYIVLKGQRRAVFLFHLFICFFAFAFLFYQNVTNDNGNKDIQCKKKYGSVCHFIIIRNIHCDPLFMPVVIDGFNEGLDVFQRF